MIKYIKRKEMPFADAIKCLADGIEIYIDDEVFIAEAETQCIQIYHPMSQIWCTLNLEFLYLFYKAKFYYAEKQTKKLSKKEELRFEIQAILSLPFNIFTSNDNGRVDDLIRRLEYIQKLAE